MFLSVEVTGVMEPEKQVYNQSNFAQHVERLVKSGRFAVVLNTINRYSKRSNMQCYLRSKNKEYF
jgi:hypothetical protein